MSEGKIRKVAAAVRDAFAAVRRTRPDLRPDDVVTGTLVITLALSSGWR